MCAILCNLLLRGKVQSSRSCGKTKRKLTKYAKQDSKQLDKMFNVGSAMDITMEMLLHF